MALVAYDASDSDSITEEEDGGVEIVEQVPTTSETTIFSKLPDPKVGNFIDVAEENDEFLLKKEQPSEQPSIKKPIRIVAPALKDFDSDEEDEPKKKQPKVISKSSGLFSILPPPKSSLMSTKSMLPHSVQKKSKAASTPMIPRNVAMQKKVSESSRRQNTSDEEDDLNIEEFDINTWKQVCGRKPKAEPIVQVIDHSESVNVEIDTAPEPAKPYDGLDNEAFKKLVGSSKMRTENIKLIDINEDEVITAENLDRAKALTDPEADRVDKVEEPISAISKRKHHITYLAQQAKANEQELKNRWASNRFSRKQTQAKYGF